MWDRFLPPVVPLPGCVPHCWLQGSRTHKGTQIYWTPQVPAMLHLSWCTLTFVSAPTALAPALLCRACLQHMYHSRVTILIPDANMCYENVKLVWLDIYLCKKTFCVMKPRDKTLSDSLVWYFVHPNASLWERPSCSDDIMTSVSPIILVHFKRFKLRSSEGTFNGE